MKGKAKKEKKSYFFVKEYMGKYNDSFLLIFLLLFVVVIAVVDIIVDQHIIQLSR